MLADILDTEGYLVETANGGPEALMQLSEHPEIRLVISDMNMPEMTGLELIEAIASRVQSNILPINLKLPGFETGIFYRPSNQIGGDFFDAMETDKTIHFLIGDISGHC